MSPNPFGRAGTLLLALASMAGWAFIAGAGRTAVERRPVAGAEMLQTAPPLLITEVMARPSGWETEAEAEWIELHNPGAGQVVVEGWSFSDNRSRVDLPQLTLGPDEFVVVAAGEGFAALHPDYQGRLIVLERRIGNGLGNAGDSVTLFDADGAPVDAVSYGDDVTVLDPAAPTPQEGESLQRVPAGHDSDLADDWRAGPPSPGGSDDPQPATSPAASQTVIATSPPTGQATAIDALAIRLNEVLPAPRQVDWDGDGQADSADEWIEIYNSSDVELDLRGWQLDDIADGGSDPFVFPDGSLVAPRGHLLIFRRDSGVVLNNGGDEVRLLDDLAREVDRLDLGAMDPDQSVARVPDGVGPWADAERPTPGEANSHGPDTPTAGPTVPTGSVAPTATGGSATPAATPAAPTSTPAPGSLLPLVISELMYDPDGDEALGEWLEIHNPGSITVSIEGWSISDGRDEDVLGKGSVQPGGFAVVSGPGGISLDPLAPDLVIEDGRIGNGLGNQGDSVSLIDPDGTTRDAVGYGDDISAFDPSVPRAPPGWSLERRPPGLDTDSSWDWWPQEIPSPGLGAATADVEVLQLTEILPEPRSDWNGDGATDLGDEFVELHNPASRPVVVDGWRLVVGNDRFAYDLSGTLPPESHTAFFRAETQLYLGDREDAVGLFDQHSKRDVFEWQTSPGRDLSWALVGEQWSAGQLPSPGAANPGTSTAASPPTRTDASPRGETTETATWTGAVGALAGVDAAVVRIHGWVIAEPGLLAKSTFYLADAQGGVRVYAPDAGELRRGERVTVTGSKGIYYGEPQVTASSVARLGEQDAGDGAQASRNPRPITTRDVGPDSVGSLVRVTGRVTGWSSSAFVLDDGSGNANVVLRPGTGLRRPYLKQGERRTVVGVVGRYARSGDEGGYRLMPRDASDLSAVTVAPPDHLPDTGRGRARRYWPASSAWIRTGLEHVETGPGRVPVPSNERLSGADQGPRLPVPE